MGSPGLSGFKTTQIKSLFAVPPGPVVYSLEVLPLIGGTPMKYLVVRVVSNPKCICQSYTIS